MDTKKTSTDYNRDPITGEPGSHPVGTAVGTTAGAFSAAAAGAMAGAVAGPGGAAIGALAGAAMGGIAGGLLGSAITEYIDPTAEEAYWESNYKDRPYVKSGEAYDSYRPAYRYGYDAYAQYPEKSFDDVETHLERDWPQSKKTSPLQWNEARGAVRDAYERTGSEYRRLSKTSTGSTSSSAANANAAAGTKKTGTY